MPRLPTPPPERCRVDADPSRYRALCKHRDGGHCACWDTGAGPCCHCFEDSWSFDTRPSRPTYLAMAVRWVRSAPETPGDLALMLGGTLALVLVATISASAVSGLVWRIARYFWGFFAGSD